MALQNSGLGAPTHLDGDLLSRSQYSSVLHTDVSEVCLLENWPG